MSEFDNLPPNDDLKAENDFLKMKMMLENGASFGLIDGDDLPAEIENQFLRQVMEFEKQFANKSTTTVFNKIGQPTIFKDVNEISDENIETAWQQLNKYMGEHGVNLGVSSPNISARELYRFATEELFDHDMTDMDIPGMSWNFIYDEFYPDYKYDNTNYAVNDYIERIFKKEPHDFWPWLGKEVMVNNRSPMSEKEFTQCINQFKAAHDDIELEEAVANDCTIVETECIVSGTYNAIATIGNEKLAWKNTWKVVFHFDDNSGYYSVAHIIIDGINF